MIGFVRDVLLFILAYVKGEYVLVVVVMEMAVRARFLPCLEVRN
jgi:hypothetical protein